MKFCWATISVRDMGESLEFYQNIVGLEVSERLTPGEDKEVIFLGKDETKVELLFNPEYPRAESPQGIFLGFQVESLDRQLEFVKEHGIEVSAGPYQPVPQVRFFFVKDPNGVSIQFVEKND